MAKQIWGVLVRLGSRSPYFVAGDTFKRPSHVKLILENSCWQTQIGVCEPHNNMLAKNRACLYSRQLFANMLCCSHTPI